MASKLTTSYIRQLFNPLTAGDTAGFFANIVDDVEWIVTGTAQIAGRWTNKEQYLKDGWYRIGKILQKPMQLSLQNVLVVECSGTQGLEGTAVVELKGTGGILLSGKEYNNEYCWIVEFNAEGKIKRVKAYLDTAKLRDALDENEKK